MTWQEYEIEVYDALQPHYPNADVRLNFKKQGKYSKTKRQIDVFIIDTFNGKTERIAVESKFYNKKINVKIVESFISMLADLDVDLGIMVTEKGFTKSALQRAQNNPEQITLDILSLQELKELQGLVAFPYSGNNAALLHAPFGWVIDAYRRHGSICTLYPRGQTFEEATINMEIAYINYWDRDLNNESLEHLQQMQDEGIRTNAESFGLKIYELTYLVEEPRTDARTAIRKANIQNYPGIELTGFVEFDHFIFFCVLLSNPLHLDRNIKKIRSMLRLVLPLRINNGDR
jgi:hypothetical protein